MKITDTIISIPPYISTSWDKVSSLHMKLDVLVVTLIEGKEIEIPHLGTEVIEQIFSAHASFLENSLKKQALSKETKKSSFFSEQETPFPFSLSMQTLENIGQVGQALQHNPAHKDLPKIPDELAAKIASLAKVISEEEILSMPLPEKNCNCMYCQINRILRKAVGQDLSYEDQKEHESQIKELPSEKVSDEELQFEEWHVTELRDHMYKVTNKLDPKEEYTVYLGTPVGCTCGKANCEHIIAALRS